MFDNTLGVRFFFFAQGAQAVWAVRRGRNSQLHRGNTELHWRLGLNDWHRHVSVVALDWLSLQPNNRSSNKLLRSYCLNIITCMTVNISFSWWFTQTSENGVWCCHKTHFLLCVLWWAVYWSLIMFMDALDIGACLLRLGNKRILWYPAF